MFMTSNFPHHLEYSLNGEKSIIIMPLEGTSVQALFRRREIHPASKGFLLPPKNCMSNIQFQGSFSRVKAKSPRRDFLRPLGSLAKFTILFFRS